MHARLLLLCTLLAPAVAAADRRFVLPSGGPHAPSYQSSQASAPSLGSRQMLPQTEDVHEPNEFRTSRSQAYGSTKVRIDTATQQQAFGDRYCKAGNYQETIDFRRRMLEERDGDTTEDHLALATALHDLASAYLVEGQLDEALDHYKEALRIREDLLAHTHSDLQATHAGMATTFHCLGDVGRCYLRHTYKRAIAFCKTSIAIREGLLDSDHEATQTTKLMLASVHHRFANTHVRGQRYQEAIHHYNQALSLRQDLLGDHLHTALTHYALGYTYSKQANYERALHHYTSALRIRQDLLGDHVDTATIHHQLGCTYDQLECYDEALNTLQEALRMRQDLLNDHVHTATTHYQLGYTYGQLEHYEDALRHYASALRIRQKRLGDYVDTALAHYALGCTYSKLAHYKQATTHLQAALGIYRQLLGESRLTIECAHRELAHAQRKIEEEQSMHPSTPDALPAGA